MVNELLKRDKMKTINIKGTGKLNLKPNLIELPMSINFKSKTYKSTYEGEEKLYQDVLAIFMDLGFNSNDLKTKSFEFDTNYKQVRVKKEDETEYKSVFMGYEINHRVVIEFDLDNEKLSNILIAITSLKKPPRFNINFTIRDKETAKNQLLIEATKDAKRKAEILATASDVSLGDIVKISYSWADVNVYSSTDFLANCNYSMESISFNPEDIKMKDTVDFVWEIK